MVPSSKLLWVAGTLIVPLSAIAGAIPERAPLALGLLGFVIVAALYDAVRSSSSLHGLRFKSGGILRISRGRTGELDLIIDTGNTPPPSPVRIGMPMPRARSIFAGVSRIKRPCICPPTQRKAAAASTPSGAPPIPR